MSDVAPAAGSDAALSAAPDGLISAGDAWIAQAVGVGALSLANATTLSPVGDLLDAAARRLLHGLDETVRYEHRDHLGSVASVTDEAGQQVQRTQYYPFGALRHVTGDEPEQGYTGKERDDTGLVHFGARYLDPLAGRWDAPDPHFDVSGPEQADRLAESLCDYSFMLGRPLCGVDQNGERQHHAHRDNVR